MSQIETPVLDTEKKSEIAIIASNIENGLVAFNTRKQEVSDLAKKAKLLEIATIDDKEAIKNISETRKALKAARVLIQKEGKYMRDPLTQMGKKISEKEKELVDIITPEEDRLQEKEDWVKEELDRIKAEELEKENQRIQARIDSLSAVGFGVDYAFIKSMDDETFERTLKAATTQFEKDEAEKATREAEEKRLQEEAAELLRKEKEELEELRKKQAAADQKLKEQQEELERQRKELADASEKVKMQKVRARMEQCESLGLIFSMQEESFMLKDVYVSIVDVKAYDDAKWSDMIKGVTVRVAEINKAAEESERLKGLEEDRLQEEARKEKEKKEKEAEELKVSRQPDKQKIHTYILALKSVAVPQVNTPDGQIVLDNVGELLTRLVKYGNDKADAL